jgi:hypothetical protein
LQADGPVDIELWGAAQKRDLLELALDVRIQLGAEPAVDATQGVPAGDGREGGAGGV